jgi:hypothetical protein
VGLEDLEVLEENKKMTIAESQRGSERRATEIRRAYAELDTYLPTTAIIRNIFLDIKDRMDSTWGVIAERLGDPDLFYKGEQGDPIIYYVTDKSTKVGHLGVLQKDTENGDLYVKTPNILIVDSFVDGDGKIISPHFRIPRALMLQSYWEDLLATDRRYLELFGLQLGEVGDDLLKKIFLKFNCENPALKDHVAYDIERVRDTDRKTVSLKVKTMIDGVELELYVPLDDENKWPSNMGLLE